MSRNLDPHTSPNISNPGVRRLNNVPIIAIFAVAIVIIGAIIYTFHQRMQEQQKRAAEESNNIQPQAGNPNDALSGAPQAGLIASRPAQSPPPSLPAQAQANRQLNPVEQAQLQAWTDYEQRKAALNQAHYQAEISAIGASADVRSGSSLNSLQLLQTDHPALEQTGRTQSVTPTLDTMQAGPQAWPRTTTIAPTMGGYNGLAGGILTSGGNLPPANPNANDQTGKRNFLAQPGSSANDDYLQARITTPASPYEVKAGSVIPATMIGGVNSDLPGQVIAQVRENVYDTATGRYLLIPQGARLVGVYHSGVSYGQTRVLAAWNRVIYPNGDSFDLGQMPGADEGGYAGFTDEVNNHYLTIFGSALLASVFSAGTQLSQPQNSNSSVNSTQILAASVGQQANTVGSMLIARGLDIQPTLEIRNGYLFNIIVTKDLILQPWAGMQPLPYGAASR